jgi:hypothetical protein
MNFYEKNNFKNENTTCINFINKNEDSVLNNIKYFFDYKIMKL